MRAATIADALEWDGNSAENGGKSGVSAAKAQKMRDTHG